MEIDLRGKSPLADYMIIVSGRSPRHVRAMAQHLLERLKKERNIVGTIEGDEVGEWVLVDAGDVIVHIFVPEVRDFYNLEKLWKPEVAKRTVAA